MKLLRLLPLLFVSCVHALTTGDVEVRVYNGFSFTPTYLSWSNGQVITKTGGSPALVTLNAAAVGLGSVENTAVSTWAGSTNLTTLGTISTGSWNATPIPLGKIAQGGATSGQVLSWNGSAWAPAAGGSGGLEIGTSAITGGTSGYVLYDSAGVLGKTAATSYGRGLLNTADAAAAQIALDLEPYVDVMPYTMSMAALHSISGNPAGYIAVTDGLGGYSALDVFGNPNMFTAAQTVSLASLGATTAAGFGVVNSTAATSGNQQVSPSMYLEGKGWGTTAGTSQAVTYRWYVQPVQGASPTGNLKLQVSINGGSWSDLATLASSGALTFMPMSFDQSGNVTLNTSNAYIRASGRGPNLGVSGFGTAMSDNGPVTGSSAYFAWSDGASYDGTIDTRLLRVAKNVVKVTDESANLGTFDAAAHRLNGSVTWTSGSGSPEGVVTAPVGSLYSRTDGGLLTTLYVKESGSGNTGWVAK